MHEHFGNGRPRRFGRWIEVDQVNLVDLALLQLRSGWLDAGVSSSWKSNFVCQLNEFRAGEGLEEVFGADLRLTFHGGPFLLFGAGLVARFVCPRLAVKVDFNEAS